MSAFSTERQLLLGLLALQNGFISRDQLVAAFGLWTGDKSRALESILVDQKALDAASRDLLAALAERHLAQHNQDPAQSLAALSSVASARSQLAQLGDADLSRSLGQVSTQHTAVDPFATRAGVSQIPGERFQILRPHAAGGLGTVSVAFDTEVPREVALKEIRPESSDNIEARARFLREAEITGGLEHPGIVPVYGLGTYADGRPYYAMKFIKGDSLQTATEWFHVRRQAGECDFNGVEFRELLQRFIDVCQAMQYAHDRGVLHRDLKPGNIMLGQYGETLVVDWGLAKPLGERRGVPESHDKPVVPRTPLSGSDVAGTLAGSAIGTPQYMSPEQAEGRVDELGPTTDVYALGATLYHVLTGKPPAAGGNIVEVLDNVRRGQLVPPRERVAAIPRPLEAICRKALSLQPTDRYAQTRQLADEIRSWLADEPVQAYPESWGAQTARWFRRHRGVALTLSVATPVLLSSMGIASYLIGVAEQAAAQSHFRETQALALTTHVTAFETALEKPDWDEAHWQRLDDTVTQLQTLQPERAQQARERMVLRFAGLLDARLQRPRLTDADVLAFEADLARLEPRDAAAAARVRQALAARLNSWEMVAELHGDFSGWDRIFSTANVGLEQGRLVRKPAVITEAPSPTMPPDRVPTSLAATADVQCEATFDGAALETGVLGIEFLASDVSGYSFLLIPVPPSDVPGNDEGHEVERASRLVIQRDGQTLRETRLLKRELAKETLVLHALRRGERLQVQVNDLPPMELLDPFPLPTSQPGQVALRWGPESGSLLWLAVSQWRQPSAPSPLEVADRLYAAGEFRDALRKYDEQAQQSQGSEFAREARYKQGVCLQELGRIDDSRQIYEQLSSEEADRWSTLADFQLWARAVETNEADLSEAIYLRLSQKYSFKDLARIAPDSIRKRITEFGKFETSAYERYLIYDPNRLSKSQRAFDVLGLLDPGSLAYHTAAEVLIKDAAVLGRYDLALQVLHEKIPYIEASWFDDILLDVLLSSGQSLAALEEVEKLAQSPRFRGRHWDCHFAVHRAQCLNAIGRIDEARALIAATLPSLRIIENEEGSRLATFTQLLRTYASLEYDAGHHEAELSAWRELASPARPAHAQAKHSWDRSYITARAMSGLIDETDAVNLIEIGANLDRSGFAQIVMAYVPREKLILMLMEMWRSPRAREIERKIARGQSLSYEVMLSFPTLAAYQFCVSAFPKTTTDFQFEEACWVFADHTVRRLSLDGTLQRAHLLPLAITWKGNAGFLGWSTVQGTLPAEYRGEAAYFFGLRFQQLGQPAEARKFFQTTVRDTAPDSLFARLAARELGAMGD